MAQPGVGERRQPASGLTVIGDNGLAREVAAGHHEYARARWVADKSEEQPMHGRIGKHDPEIGRVRRDVSSQLHSPVGASLQQQPAFPIEEKDRDRAVKRPAPMNLELGTGSDLDIGVVHQDDDVVTS